MAGAQQVEGEVRRLGVHQFGLLQDGTQERAAAKDVISCVAFSQCSAGLLLPRGIWRSPRSSLGALLRLLLASLVSLSLSAWFSSRFVCWSVEVVFFFVERSFVIGLTFADA